MLGHYIVTGDRIGP